MPTRRPAWPNRSRAGVPRAPVAVPDAGPLFPARRSAQLPHSRGPRLRRAEARLIERQRHRLDDLEPVPRKAHEPERPVREPADLPDADVAQDLRADAELAEVREPRAEGGARRARAVPAGAGEEVEAAAVATKIEDDALPLRGDALHRLLEEAPRVALAVPEDVARKVLEVRAHEHRLVGPELALHEDQVLRLVDVGGVDERPELPAVARRDARLRRPVHERVVAAPVLDQLGNGRDLEAVLGGEAFEVWQPCHRAVLAQDLADDAGRLEAGEARQVDRAFRLPGANEHAATPGAEREHVPRRDDVGRRRVGTDGGPDGRRAVDRRDAAADSLSRVDRHGERGAERGAVLAHHHREAELVAALLGERQADEPAPVR